MGQFFPISAKINCIIPRIIINFPEVEFLRIVINQMFDRDLLKPAPNYINIFALF